MQNMARCRAFVSRFADMVQYASKDALQCGIRIYQFVQTVLRQQRLRQQAQTQPLAQALSPVHRCCLNSGGQCHAATVHLPEKSRPAFECEEGPPCMVYHPPNQNMSGCLC